MKTSDIFEKKSNKEIPLFFGKLFKFRNDVHLRHLSVKSYSEHIALNELYEEMLDYIDDLIESYQGKYGLLNLSIGTSDTISYNNSLTLIDTIINTVELSYNLFNESWIKNQLDELLKLLYKIKYKLTNLK